MQTYTHKKQMTHTSDHKHSLKSLISLLIGLPPPPYVSPRVEHSPITIDMVLQTQLTQIRNKLLHLCQILEEMAEQSDRMPCSENKKLCCLLNLLSIIPPPIPPIPEPPSKTKKLLKAKYPGVGKGKSPLRMRKHNLPRKNIYSDLLQESKASFSYYTGLEHRDFKIILGRVRHLIEKPRRRMYLPKRVPNVHFTISTLPTEEADDGYQKHTLLGYSLGFQNLFYLLNNVTCCMP